MPDTETTLTPEQLEKIERQTERLLASLTFGEPTRGNRYVESVDGDYYFEEHVDNEFDAFDLLRQFSALHRSLRAAWADIARFSTLADERHDLLSAERRANDELRAERAKMLQSLERAQQERNRLSGENATFQENEKSLKAQLAQAQSGLREQREAIKFWQRHITRMGALLGSAAMDTEVETAVKALQSKLAQVEQERNAETERASKWETRAHQLGREVQDLERERNALLKTAR